MATVPQFRRPPRRLPPLQNGDRLDQKTFHARYEAMPEHVRAKKGDYEQAGVREYVVVALRMSQIFWFVRRRGRFKELTQGRDGIFRSEVFPGLWLDSAAMLRGDRKGILTVLRRGLASAEHAAFVAKLAKR